MVMSGYDVVASACFCLPCSWNSRQWQILLQDKNIRSAMHARSGSPLMINHLTSYQWLCCGYAWLSWLSVVSASFKVARHPVFLRLTNVESMLIDFFAFSICQQIVSFGSLQPFTVCIFELSIILDHIFFEHNRTPSGKKRKKNGDWSVGGNCIPSANYRV